MAAGSMDLVRNEIKSIKNVYLQELNLKKMHCVLRDSGLER